MVLKDTGTAFVSTPCYDPITGAAANHVNEMSFTGFKALILAAGLQIEKVYGTFASQKDYKHLLDPAQLSVFNALSAYYDSNLVACIFAPLFPAESRNCLWQLKRTSTSDKSLLSAVTKPHHSSSQLWTAFINKLLTE